MIKNNSYELKNTNEKIQILQNSKHSIRKSILNTNFNNKKIVSLNDNISSLVHKDCLKIEKIKYTHREKKSFSNNNFFEDQDLNKSHYLIKNISNIKNKQIQKTNKNITNSLQLNETQKFNQSEILNFKNFELTNDKYSNKNKFVANKTTENNHIIDLCSENSEEEILNNPYLEINKDKDKNINFNSMIDKMNLLNPLINHSYSHDISFSKESKEINSNFNYKFDINEYIPCNHIGECTIENCLCIRERGCCEKFCFCFPSCKYVHKGCNCLNKCENSCICKTYNRECDPDICHKYPIENEDDYYINQDIFWRKKRTEDILYGNLPCCKNMNMYLNKTKKTYLSKSLIIDSFGLFTREDIKQNDFICEYKGELINKEETDRRSIFNDQFGLNYFFRVNKKMDIDAFRQGNEMR